MKKFSGGYTNIKGIPDILRNLNRISNKNEYIET